MPRKWTEDQVERVLLDNGGVIRRASRAAGISFGVLQAARVRLVAAGKLAASVHHASAAIGKKEAPVARGAIRATGHKEMPLPAKGKIARYVLTSAQNNTLLFDDGWNSLVNMAGARDAKLLVSRFTYDKTAASPHGAKPGTQGTEDGDLWYDPRILPHVADERILLAPGLMWCGEMNILPTAVRPLSGLETYTGRASGIFPHVKLAMESIPSGKYEPTKFNYTTGTITQRNYIQKKAGQKAEFHHCYGGLLVEVDHKGNWWVRQLNADSEGTIYDLDLKATPQGAGPYIAKALTRGPTFGVKGINWGDIHAGRVEPQVQETAADMVAVLQPEYQFMHDVLDFRSRRHHDAKDPHRLFQRYMEGDDDVENEVTSVAALLAREWPRHPGGKLVVVDSNHDGHMERWLREADYRQDPKNALFFLEAQLRRYQAIAAGDKFFHLFEWACRRCGLGEDAPVKFLREDESFIICQDRGGGIECGMHGHLGANGSRGGANVFAKAGRKSNVGHTHSAGIVDGVYTAGTSSLLDLEFNKGLSSWSWSHVLTYPNGKRAIVTIWDGKWRA